MKPAVKWTIIVVGALTVIGVISSILKSKKSETDQVPSGLRITPTELLHDISDPASSLQNDAGGHEVSGTSYKITWKDSAGYVTGTSFSVDGPISAETGSPYYVAVQMMKLWLRNIVGEKESSNISAEVGQQLSQNTIARTWPHERMKISSLKTGNDGSLIMMIGLKD